MAQEPNNTYLLYYTKYQPYNTTPKYNNTEVESLELNEDENDNNNATYNGRWSQKEHLLFIKGCLLYGNFWKKVKKYIKTRTCSQIRSHAQKYFYKLNKKYGNNKSIKNNNKLNEEEINKIVNKNRFNEKDVEMAELYILNLFNINKDKDKEKDKDKIFDKEDNNINYTNNNNINNRKNMKIKKMESTTKERIFNIEKVSKSKKNRIRTKNKKYENSDYITDFKENEKENDNDENISEYDENNNNKILKENILADQEDINIILKKEEFINKCLDSKDPKDLVKLLTYFGNDINFKVNDIKMLKKYQYYLGLDIDNNSEENNTNNNKEENILNKNNENSNNNNMNGKENENGYYPYLFTQTGTGIQFSPLFNNQKMILNPQIINHN